MHQWTVLGHLLLLWAAVADAFFPWFPPKICAKDDSLCKAQTASQLDTRQAVSEAAAPAAPAAARTFVFDLRSHPHSVHANDDPIKVRVGRIAQRLTWKHNKQARQPTATVGSAQAKRSNTYTIVTAATPKASHAVGIDQDGTDFSYFVPVTFGSSKTALYMLLDTGAGTTWAMGDDCVSKACGMHNRFGPDDSKTLTLMAGKSFSISYGSGAVNGSLAHDTIAITPALKVPLSFGLANTTSDDFTHFPFDGILGLGLSRGATDNFWQAVRAAKLLDTNVFAIALWRADDGTTNSGQIMFGGTDSGQYTGSIAYTAVADHIDGDWAVPMDDLGYAGGKAGITGRVAYIDTGTTYVFGPVKDVATLHAQIPGASSTDGGVTYSVPCSNNKPLTVYFSGVAYDISAADWLSPDNGDGICTSNIYGHAVVADAWLLGDLFIKNVYAVFDIDNKRIGFASRPTPTSTVSLSGTVDASTMPITGAPKASSTADSSSHNSGGGDSSSVLPGLSGHETSVTMAGSSATVSASAQATGARTSASPAGQLESSSVYVSVVCVVAALAMAV